MRRIEVVLVILGVLSLVVFAIPELGLFAAMTIIGLPIAFVFWFTPAAFLLVFVAYLIHRVLPLPGKIGVLVSMICAPALLAIPPLFLNGPIDRSAQSIAAGDLDKLRLSIEADTIASRENFRFAKDATPCDAFCLHALLSETAKKFLVAHTKTPHEKIAPEEDVTAFWLERRSSCPPVNFNAGRRGLKFKFSKADKSRAADPVETLKLKISNGLCLISGPARLGDADLIISRGKLAGSARLRKPLGFSLTAKPASSERIAVHRKENEIRFNEIYRRTEVRYRPFAWLLLPAVSMQGTTGRLGWWRREQWINVKRRYEDSFAWTAFLTKKLGFKLKLSGDQAARETRDKLKKLLDEGKTPDKANWALFSQFFDRAGRDRNTRLDAEDFELGLRVLENLDYPAPPRLHNFINYAKRNGKDPAMSQLAGFIVTRLNNNRQNYWHLGVKPREEIKTLALGIRRLPAAHLLPHKEAMIAVASRPDVQLYGYFALQRLAVFGDDAVPTLLQLMKTGLAGGDKFFRKNQFQHPYIAGLIGLCEAGPSATSALADLRKMQDQGVLPTHASYGRLLFKTLIRLGENTEHVRELFKASARNEAYATDERFQRLVVRANRKNPDCHY